MKSMQGYPFEDEVIACGAGNIACATCLGNVNWHLPTFIGERSPIFSVILTQDIFYILGASEW